MIGVRPARVLVVPAGTIPKTPSGKLKRAAAREMLVSGLAVDQG
jgi:fatty-acyl-CoA synthase